MLNQSDAAIQITGPRSTGSINDNDNAAASVGAVLSVTQNGDETGPVDIIYTVTLSKTNNTGGQISFNIAHTGGTTTPGTDFTSYGTGTIRVNNGASTGTFTVNVTNDNLFEAANETAAATISSPSDPAVALSTPTATATIADNDNAVNADLVVTQDGDENGTEPVILTVELDKTNNTGSPITFVINSTGGTATSGTDYTAFDGFLVTVPDGRPFGSITIPVIQDALTEGIETVTATISSPSNPAVTINTASVTANISDDETAPPGYNAYLTFVTAGDETGPTSVEFRVYLDYKNASGVPMVFNIDPTGGTATAGSDYTTFAGGTITIPVNGTTGTLLVPVINDTLWESDETVIATISNPPGGVTIANASATGTIFDNDNGQGTIPVTLSVTQQGSEVGPTNIIYRLQASKVNNTGSPITFSFNPTGGTAQAVADYANFAGSTLSIPNGSDFTTFTVNVLDDTLFENTHTVIGTISNPSDAAIDLSTSTIVVTADIVDDDNPVDGINADLSVTQQGAEAGPTNIVYTVTLAKANNTSGNINFTISATGGIAISGSDYISFGSNSISVPSGSATGTFTVSVTDDATFENTETLQLTLSAPSDPAIHLNTPSASGNIVDNDNASATIAAVLAATKVGTEQGPTSLIYTVTLAKPNYSVNGDITFAINPTGGSATAGADYTDFTGGTITVPYSKAFGTLSIPVVDDTFLENNESVQATISASSDPAIILSTPTATGTITDNDNIPNSIPATLTVDTNGDEAGPVSLVYRVTLTKTNDTHAPISFVISPSGGTANEGVDYFNFSNATISVPDGSNTGTYTAAVTDDALFENTETATATISGSTDPSVYIATNSATANILDNDNGAATVNASLSATVNGNEAGLVGVQFTVTLASVNNTGAPITFTIGQSGGTATVGSDYTSFTGSTVTVPVGSATGTFTASVLQDTLFENSETLQATISSPSDPAINIATASATGTILDNDNGAGTVTSVLSAVQTGTESGTALRWRVRLGTVNNTGGGISFTINPTGGTATNVADYADFSGLTVTVPNGSTDGFLDVAPVDDALFENTESVQATISAPTDPAVALTTATASGNITDNDNTANSIDATIAVTQNGNETGPVNVIFTVTLAKVNNTSSAITINLTNTGTATLTSDYTAVSATTISIPVGANSATRTLTVVDDALFENNETVINTLTTASDPAIRTNSSSATASITDNDNGAGTVSANLTVQTQGSETGPTAVVYRVTLSKTNNTQSAITVAINPSGGTATVVSDYANFTGQTVSIAAGSSTGTRSVAVVDDALFENTETVSATISAPSDAAVAIGTASATANISDNDNGAGTVNAVLSTTTNGSESGLNVQYTITLSKTNNTGAGITFVINPTGGTATAVSDYSNFAGNVLTVPNGANSILFSIPVVDDALFENTETVTGTISSPSDPAIGIGTASATANIADNDNPAATIPASLSISQSGNETGPQNIIANVTIGTVNDTQSPITFTLAQTAGTATAGSDYTFAGTISVPVGSNTGSATLSVVNDTLFENTESVTLTISSPSDPAITISTASDSTTIVDNDNGAGTITANLSGLTNGNEAGPVSGVYQVTLSKVNNTHGPISFAIDPNGGTAAAPGDYTSFSGGMIVVADGSATGTFAFTVVNDTLFENTETVGGIISVPSDAAIAIGTAAATVNIIDNDNTANSINAVLSVTQNGDETGPIDIIYTVTLAKTNNTGSPITVEINQSGGSADADDDFVDFDGTLVTIPNGSATGSITVIVSDDALFENDETVQAALSNASDPALNLTLGTATATIADDDNDAASVTADLDVQTNGNETGPISIVYRVVLGYVNNTHAPIVFDIDPAGGTATAGFDYADFAGGSISVPDGSDTGTFSVAVTDDGSFESLETATATISSPSDPAIDITTDSATANITDNDSGGGAVTAALSTTTQGNETGPVAIVYTVTLSNTNNTGAAITFTIAPTAGTATATADYTDFSGGTITVADGAMTGTFSVPVVNDALFENAETVTATISNPSNGAILITGPSATATISDSDNVAGSIDASLSVQQQGNESGPVSIAYTVALSVPNNTGGPITFTINPTGGTATAGADYQTFAGGTVTIPNTASTGSLIVPVFDDALFENTETATATISNPSDAAIAIGTASATANITDSDNVAGSISTDLSVTTQGDEEGPVSIVYTVTLGKTNNTGSAITVAISPTGGTAVANDDYTDFSSVTVTIANGAADAILIVPVVDDLLFENDETVTATISAPSDPALSITTPSATATIADNDNAAGSITANLSVASNGSEAGPVSVRFGVTLSAVNTTGSPITFDIEPIGGTATDGTDYVTFAGGAITIDDGEFTGSIEVPVNVDTLFENTETVTAQLSNPSDPAVAIGTDMQTANIVDANNGAGTISADLSATIVGNETGPVGIQYTVTLGVVNNTGAPITFSLNPNGGTATGGADYTDFTGATISVADGESTGTYTVPVTDDALFESTETVIAALSSPSDPAIAIGTDEATGSILDSDSAAGTIDASLSVQTNGDESGPVNIVYLVTLAVANNTGSPITFDISATGGTATGGADYTSFGTGTVTIADGASTGTFTVTVLDDALFENSETVEATISNPSNPAITVGTAAATATVADSDNSAGSVDATLSVTTQGNESGPVAIVYTVTLAVTNDTGGPITFEINPSGGSATTGADYDDFTGVTVTIPNGANSATVSVPVVGDTLFENTETVAATISNPSDPAINIATGTASANISDDDNGAGTVTADIAATVQGNETGPVSVVYTVTLSKVNNTAGPITLAINPTGGTASGTSDYVDFSSGTVTIAVGDSSATFSVTVVDDASFEGSETVQATISAPSDPAVAVGTGVATGTILDDEALLDSDLDGILDGNECVGGELTCPDSDGDGLPNHLDNNDDGDGVPTINECPGGVNCPDTDGDSVPDYLEHNMQDTDGDNLPDYLDTDDDGDGTPTTQEVNDPLVIDDADGDGIPDYLDADDNGSTSGDSDGDGFTDAQECPSGYLCPDTDGNKQPDYMQPAAEIVDSPVYTIWNSFLDQVTVEVFTNKGTQPLNVIATVLDLNGNQLGRQTLTLAPSQEFDLIVNDIPGYSRDSYGLVRLDFNRPRSLEGHSAAYRITDDGFGFRDESNIEFGILRPFGNLQRGTTYAFFNTNQPSFNPADANNTVPNWVQIGNADATLTKSFTVKKYDDAGVLLDTIRTTIPPQGRRDVDGGHARPGGRKIGLVQIIPDDPNARYLAQVFHYGYNVPAGIVPTGFSFADGEASREGVTQPQYLNISRGAGSITWVAVANVTTTPTTARVRFIDNDGTQLFNEVITLGKYSQRHIAASNYLAEGHTGVAIVTPLGSNKIISNTRSYYYQDNGSVTEMSLLEGRHLLGDDISSLYNTFFNQLNWLRIFNTSGQSQTFTIETYNNRGVLIGVDPLTLPAQHGIDVELFYSLGVPVQNDSYGIVRINPNNPGVIFAESRRIKPGAPGIDIDLSKPLPLR